MCSLEGYNSFAGNVGSVYLFASDGRTVLGYAEGVVTDTGVAFEVRMAQHSHVTGHLRPSKSLMWVDMMRAQSVAVPLHMPTQARVTLRGMLPASCASPALVPSACNTAFDLLICTACILRVLFWPGLCRSTIQGKWPA